MKESVRSVRGFTLIELLITVTIAGLLAAMAAPSLLGLRRQLDVETAAQTISQDLQRVRSQSLSSKTCNATAAEGYVCWRLRFTGSRGYVLEEYVSGSWKTRDTVTFSDNLTFPGHSTGDGVTFDTRGFGDFRLPGGAIRVSDGADSLRIVPSMTGAVRIVRP